MGTKNIIGELTINGSKVITENTLPADNFSGSYNDLTDKPTIPTKVSDLDNDEGYLTSYTENDPTVPSHVKGITTTDIENWNNKSTFDGNYDNLTNKPAIPSISGLATETYVDNKVAALVDSAPEALNTLGELATALNNHEDAYDALLETVGSKADKSSLATVATSGQYGDLIGTPTIPTVPTKVSSFENDKGYLTSYTETDPTVPAHVKGITEANISSWNAKSDFSGSYNDLTDKPTIPAAVTVDTALSSTSTNPVQNKVINSALEGYLPNDVTELDLFYDEVGDLNQGDSGITWSDQFALYKGTSVEANGIVRHLIPIVPGENVTFTKTDDNMAFVINVTTTQGEKGDKGDAGASIISATITEV